MLKPVVIEYWHDPDGGLRAQAFDYPIAASGASLVQLKDHIAHQIRECFRPGPIPGVYDLVLRAEPSRPRGVDPPPRSGAAASVC